ncbi:hypothetical protein [uncultured Roseobacter sp.]|uniref:hypothetical protein n=1 Tax=uncultured Roseobacter sp. TaxID=114847 RepID=UPI00261273EF|nr:hypothetical protein [uncultured Roseobacter sp.]
MPQPIMEQLPKNCKSVLVERYTTTVFEEPVNVIHWVLRHIQPTPIFTLEIVEDATPVSEFDCRIVSVKKERRLHSFDTQAPMKGHYLALACPIDVDFDEQRASETIMFSVNMLRLFFGESFCEQRHNKSLYTLEKGSWAITQTSPVYGSFPETSVFQFSKLSGDTFAHSGLAVTTTAIRLFDLAVAENQQIDLRFILLWTAFEAQLGSFPGKSSGDRRKAFATKLASPQINDELFYLFKEKRNVYLKEPEHAQITFRDYHSLRQAFMISAIAGSSDQKEAAQEYIDWLTENPSDGD